ncbi:hypothetical protein [Shewanella sp. 8A]|uniref:hypothetical protein n=1 Tax=Shewanella sp. 8A TaxID=2943323 RepID=UPI00201ABF98|nr:hypothetical protein [Shewanella sp. 8A]
MTRLMGELIGYADQITSYGFSSTDLGNKAIAWCKKRKLQGALGGPVGLEFGGPNCDWD